MTILFLFLNGNLKTTIFQILYDENSKVKVGEVIGILNDKKKLDLEKVVSKKIIFTEKAKQLIKKHNLSEDQFSSKNC